MALRTVAYLRAPIFLSGQVLTLVLLVLDARREWSAYGFVLLGLVLGALAALPAALVDSAVFRLAALVTQTIGAGVVALNLSDTADKRALWAYALSTLVAVVLPAGRPALGRTTVLGVGLGLVLTIGAAAPALAWDGGLFDPGASAADADDVARRYAADPRVASVSRAL